MAYDETVTRRLRAAMDAEGNVVEKKMFGGLAFMIGGNMCCGVTGDELMVRVGGQTYEDALDLPHAREMDFTGRPLKGFVYVASEGFAAEADLNAWVARGIAFAKSLPPK